MLSVVGFCIRRSWSVCCFAIIRLYLGVCHVFRRRFGVRSYCSMLCCSAFWSICSRCDGSVLCGVCVCAMMRACWIAGSIVRLCFVYLLVDRVFCLLNCCLGVWVWNVA